MNKHKHADPHDFGSLAEDARALMAATVDVAGDKVHEARKRLATALERGGDMLNEAKDSAIEGAKTADKAVRNNPYQAIGIALGAGLLLGYLVARRRQPDRD